MLWLCSFFCILFALSWGICQPPLREARHLPESLILQDRTGKTMRIRLNQDGMDCRPRPNYNPQGWIAKAFIAAEDARFQSHSGIDPLAIARAIRQNISTGRRISGASTITQQTVRLIAPKPRTWHTKYAEAFQAMGLECAMSKGAILSQYLNRVPLGGNCVGVQAAAEAWFGKAPENLSLGEAALLAGMAQSPERLRPDRQLQAALRRRTYVLNRMLALGFILPVQHASAMSLKIELYPAQRPFDNPWFADWVIARTPTRTGKLTTSLDPNLQALAKTCIDEQARHNGGDLSAIIIDVKTSALRAMACSGDYTDPRAGQVNTTTTPRPSGSTLKPFLLAQALDAGLASPAQVVADVPRQLGNFSPNNFDGLFRGTTRMDDALVASLNMPFIDLVQKVGLVHFASVLGNLGLQHLPNAPAQHGAGLAIGSASVRLCELANAYAALARGGEWRPLAFLDNAPPGAPRRLFSTEATWIVSHILAGQQRSKDSVGHEADTLLPRIAWKTGTSSNHRDAWAVAWTPEYVVAIWCGNKSGKNLQTPWTGLKDAAPTAWTILRSIQPTTASWQRPTAVVERTICAHSGLLPSCHCPETTLGFAIEGRTPQTLCPWHQSSPDGNGSTLSYPPDIAAFLRQRDSRYTLSILYPANETRFTLMPGIPTQAVSIRISGAQDGERIWWFVDGIQRHSSLFPEPFIWPLEKGRHEIATATATTQASISVTVE
jgi:penicillin-binding protein 1C